MINPYRPVPSLPPPPAPPLAAPPPPAALAPAYPQPQPQAFPQPVKAFRMNWDPLGEIAFSVVGTPALAALGGVVGFLIAGPVGAARGALLGASVPGTVFAGHELIFNGPWKDTQPRTGLDTIAALMGFPLLSAAGYGVGIAIAGAAGAAWGTLIAAALPVALVVGGGAIYRWFHPPVYDPGPVPTPTQPPPRA